MVLWTPRIVVYKQAYDTSRGDRTKNRVQFPLAIKAVILIKDADASRSLFIIQLVISQKRCISQKTEKDKR